MDDNKLSEQYLPLTESTYYIMLSLVEPLHGYGIMQKTQIASNDRVRLGPGTLYGALSKLEREELIEMTFEEDRRKTYKLTDKGKRLLYLEIRRLEILVKNGINVIDKLEI